MRRHLFAMLLTALLTLSWIGEARCDTEIKWYSAQEGLALGKAKGKKVFMNFFADWCAYCKKMEQTTFKDPRVIDLLNEAYISVRVDTEKEQDLARAYFVRGLPTSWFLSETGEKISNLPGYVEPDMLLKILTFISKDKYQTMSFKSYLESQ
jgi:thioredoxin-related protein